MSGFLRRTAMVTTIAVVAIVLVLGICAVGAAGSWTDLPDSVLSGFGVTDSQVHGISSGYANGTFQPYQSISRAQFVKMFDTAFGIGPATPAGPTFSDVPATNSFYGYIEGAYAAHSVNGVGSGRFGPSLSITKQQAIAIVSRRVASAEGFGLSGMSDEVISGLLAPFSDAAQTSSSLRAELAYAVQKGITKGSNGKLNPNAVLNRISAAVLLVRASGQSSGGSGQTLAPSISGLIPSGGPTAGGTAVVINGANFTGATAVSFGGVAAGFTVDSSTRITAVSPAHAAAAVEVSVTTPAGASAKTAADNFTYGSGSPAITGQVVGYNRTVAAPLVGATVTVRIDAADPLYSRTLSNVVGTAVSDSSGSYSISTASFRGACLPIGTIVDVSAAYDGYLSVTQFGVYDRPTVLCSFDYFEGYSDVTDSATPGASTDRELRAGDGIPPLPFEHLLPNYLTTP